MLRTLFASLLLVAVASAAEISGMWSGSIETTNAAWPAYMVLHQEGETISGTAGENRVKQFPIRQGKIRGDEVTLEAAPNTSTVLRFQLTVRGDHLEGSAYENGARIGTAKLSRVP